MLTVLSVPLALIAGCSSSGVQPAPLDLSEDNGAEDGGSDSRAVEGGGSDDPGSDEAQPDVPDVDICALVTADRVQEIFETEKLPEAFDDGSSDVGDLPGVQAAFRCNYKWSDDPDEDGVAISLVLMDPVLSAGDWVASGLDGATENIEQVDGLGDAATIDRDQRAGFHADSLIAAQEIGPRLAGLTVVAPRDTSTEAFSALANEIFDNAADLE